MAEDQVDIPQSFFERLVSDKRRLALVVLGALVLIALVVWAAVAFWPSDDDADSKDSGSSELVIPEETSTASADETESVEATDTADATDGSGADASASGNGQPPSGPMIGPTKEPFLTYRLGTSIMVSGEEGSPAVQVAAAERGSLSLSPDGKTLAWIDEDAGELHVVDVESLEDRVVGPAEDVRPAWAPDSSYVCYTAPSDDGASVRRVNRNGRRDARLGNGHTPSVAGDGSAVVYIQAKSPGAPGRIVSVPAKGEAAVVGKAEAVEVIYGADGLIYSVPGTNPGDERIFTSRVDGSGQRLLVGGSALSRPVRYSSLLLSPSGLKLVFALTGDDGFSRMAGLVLDGSAPVDLTVRRDTYPTGWSADGSKVFFIEGNAFQGERTSLSSVGADGLGRRVVVEGAGL